MCTRSQSRNSNRQQQQVPPTFVEPFNLVEPIENPAHPVVTMADNRTIGQLLEAPTDGYEDAIVVPEITADKFELKHGLLTLVQNKQFFKHDKEDPHAHIRYFNKITSTMKFPNVSSTSVKLMLFPFSLEGAARIWLQKEPPRSILTWDDLVLKFINKFFPPSKTKNLRNEITRFQQRFDETFYEAWDRFNDLLRAFPHHGFLELHQLDTFYNALNSNDQDSLNSTAGGNFLDKMHRDCLRIIESKSKVRNSRNKPVVAKVSASSSTTGISPDVAELKDMVKALLLDKKSQAPAPIKAVEESCVTCVGAHFYRNCPATNGKVYRDNIQEFVSQAAAANFNQGNTGFRAPIANQIQPPGFPPVQHNQKNQGNIQNCYNQNRGNNYNQNRGNNYNQGQIYQPPVNQPPAYQAPAYQAPAPQTQGVSKTYFESYVKANDAVMQNMQSQMSNITDLLTKIANSNAASTSGSSSLPSNTVANPKGELKAITTQSEASYDGPQVSPPTSSLPKVVENKLEVTKDTVPPTNNGSTKDVQPLVVQVQPRVPNSEPVVISVSAPMPNLKQSISYPSRRNDERNRDKANDQIEKFYKIFQDMSFEISFVDALILMPKFASTLKALIRNKEKLSEMARTPLNEHCSAVILNKLPEKLGDPGKFLIPCDFPGMDECLALADLGAIINLMPLSVWKRLSLPELTPTCMTLELADYSITKPIGIAEDVSVKVGVFHFPADFVVIDFDADPRVPLILGRSFLKTGRALVDVYEGELTLRVGKEAITFNLDQTSRYSANYNDMTANRIDVIDMAYKEYSQEVLGFSNVIASGNPTPYYDPIISTSSPTLSPFGDSDFLLEEVNVFLALDDDPTSPKVDDSYYDSEGDILLLEAILNSDPTPRTHSQGDDKLPVIIAKDLRDEEKTDLIKILMEDDFKPAVQHQRRVNPKIHDVIKKEVEKLLDTGLIYPISDSPWVSPVHCVPKKDGFTVVENAENELIPTRLVTRWRVCIDYQKLNEATCKDHFPLPFMDQMLERLAGNKCMMAIFHDMIEKTMEVFMDDFSVFRNSFETCLSHLDKMLKRCEGMNLCLNWEKSHFMVKEGIVLGLKISKNGIEVDKAKVDVIAKLPHPTTVKGIRSFLGHVEFYRRFVQDFLKIAWPMTQLLEKDTLFFFSKECIEAFQTLKKKLTEAPILIAPDWDLPFELMCDASDYAIGAILGQQKSKHFQPIHYASKTMMDAQAHYTTTEKELLSVV
ncbi:reverse transcriptase domain-containing protein [Tanacetum coccineum]